MIPKKLDIMDLLDLKEEYLFEQLFYKVNELVDVVRKQRIDFLTYSGWDRDELNELLGEEASKGECRKDIWKDGVMYNDPPYADENMRNNPPQQEESRGECKHSWSEWKGLWSCQLCGIDYVNRVKPQLKEESRCVNCGFDYNGVLKLHECPVSIRKEFDKIKPLEESPKEDEKWVDDLYENFSSHWDKNGRSLETFIRELLSLAQQRTEKKIVLGLEELANTKLGKSVYQDGIRQGIRESQKYISDLNN